MSIRTLNGDCRQILPTLAAESFDCIVTSPPYWRQRDYGCAEQIGLETTPETYVDALADVFSHCWRLLKPQGSLWLNIGEKWASGGNGGGGKLMAGSRNEAWAHARNARGWRTPPPGYKDKDLVGAPWLTALRLRADGWFLRQAIIWDKVVATEPPRLDRPSISHEYIFLLSKQNDSAVRNPGEAWFMSSVWTVRPNSNVSGHSACMPEEIARRCILAGSPAGGHVLDPFGGAGTTGLVADRCGRNATLIEINRAYVELQHNRLSGEAPLLTEIVA